MLISWINKLHILTQAFFF